MYLIEWSVDNYYYSSITIALEIIWCIIIIIIIIVFILFLTAQAVLDALKADALRKQLDRDEKAIKKIAINEKLKVKYYQGIEKKLKAVCKNELSV